MVDWNIVGAIAELLSAIAVFITLVFLALQMRQFSKSTNANTVSSYMETYSSVAGRVATNSHLARIERIAHLSPEKLTLDESAQFFSHMSSWMSLWEGLWRLRRQGLITEEHWQLVRQDMVAGLSSPGGRKFLAHVLPLFDEASPELAAELKKCRDSTPTYSADWNSGRDT